VITSRSGAVTLATGIETEPSASLIAPRRLVSGPLGTASEPVGLAALEPVPLGVSLPPAGLGAVVVVSPGSVTGSVMGGSVTGGNVTVGPGNGSGPRSAFAAGMRSATRAPRNAAESRALR